MIKKNHLKPCGPGPRQDHNRGAKKYTENFFENHLLKNHKGIHTLFVNIMILWAMAGLQEKL